jgi:predicted phosphohydrolase
VGAFLSSIDFMENSIKVGIVSDLHTEFWIGHHAGPITQRIHDHLAGADIVLLAGDIDNGARAVATAKKLFPDVPVCLVAGNHEFYRQSYHDTVQALKDAALKTEGVYFLDRGACEITVHDRPLRILGATLWTDFALHGTPELSLFDAARGLNDFRLIKFKDHILTPQDTLELHTQDRAWLMEQLDVPFNGTTIVMTHHAPVSFAISPIYTGDNLSPCFASRLEQMFMRDDLPLVVFGHTHFPLDRTLESTRFVSSQTGYITGKFSVETNNYGCVVEV